MKPAPDPRTLAYLADRDQPANQDCASDRTRFDAVGARLPRPDAWDKVTGAARYTADLKRPRCLVGGLLRSRHAHARLLAVDAGRARAIEGVYVLTGEDFGVCIGIIPWTKDEPPLAREVVRYVGEPIAAVAAPDAERLAAALAAIDVTYEPLPVLATPQEALAAEVAIHAGGNLGKQVDWEFGETEAAFARSRATVSGEFHFAATTHAALEPHAVMAELGGDGRLTVWCSTQTPYYLHRELATVLDMPAHRIRVIRPHVGGGFGGKSEPFSHEVCCARLAMMSGRPVKIELTREEVFLTHRGRHAMDMRLRLAYLGEEGLAIDFEAELDGGAYSSYGMVTTYYSGTLNAGLYRVPHYRWVSRRVFTNKPPAGPKRGHGTVQPRFAIECLLDQLAERLRRDPIELRRELFDGEHVRTVNDLEVGSSGFLTCLQRVEDASRWPERFRRLPFGRGLGVAGSFYLTGTNYPMLPEPGPQSNVHLKADRSGLVTIFCGAAEIGQGSDAVLRQVVAEELGADPGRCRVESRDSDLCPVDLGSYSSRVTLMAGNAAIAAARHLRRGILAVVAQHWQVPPAALMAAGDWVFTVAGEERRMPFPEALTLAERRLGALGSTGSYNTPNRGGSYRGALVGPSPAYSFTAHVAEVEIDLETGHIRVHRIVAAHDCGRAINPTLVEGQIEGSVYMGLGEALLEQYLHAHGLVTQPNLLDYKLPTILDVGDIQAIIVEAPDTQGPYGAKEAGEGPLHPSIPAIANAVYDAIGVRLYSTPFHPATILRALASGTCAKPSPPGETR